MSGLPPQPAGPVTAGDVRDAVSHALAALRGAVSAGCHVRAGPTDWDCWETIEHVSDDLFAYAAQLGPTAPALSDHIPFACTERRPGSPACAIHADPGAGPAGLLQTLEATGALLATMGVAETIVHTHDTARPGHRVGTAGRAVPPGAGQAVPPRARRR